MAAVQGDVDALTAQITTLVDTLTAAVTQIQVDIDALKVANPGVDLTALTATVAALATEVTAAQTEATTNAPPA